MRRALYLAPLFTLVTALAHAGPGEDLDRAFTALHDWRVDDARQIGERLYARTPDHPGVLALVAEVKFHASDYPGAVHFFERAKAAGAPPEYLRHAPLALAAKEATEGYVETVSEHFIVRHAPGKDAILVPYALETLEQARDRIGDLLGWKPNYRLVVELYPSAATLAAVSTLTRKEIETSGTIALCKWNRLMVSSPRSVVFGYAWRDTIAHELAHLIIGGASKNTVPIWLHEGIAKFVETAWRGEPGTGLAVEQQKALLAAAKEDRLISFERMHPSMAKLSSQEESSLAFAEVFTFIEYMVELKGFQGLRGVLRRLSEGQTEDAAVVAVFGKPLKALSDTWIKGLKHRPIKRDGVAVAQRELVVKDRPDAPDDKLHGLSKEARRFARAADLLYARGRMKAAQRELEKAIEATPSPMLSSRLARVALATGDLDRAQAAAEAAVKGTPDLPGPMVVLAEVLVRRGDLEAARAPLEQAISINPFDPRIHFLMLAVLGPNGDPEARAHAQLASALLSGQGKVPPPLLGSGGLIEVGGLPFSRVYVEVESSEGRKQVIPTGVTTPTPPLSLRPGTVKLRLVPPAGPEAVQTVTINPAQPDARPQKIEPDTRGS